MIRRSLIVVSMTAALVSVSCGGPVAPSAPYPKMSIEGFPVSLTVGDTAQLLAIVDSRYAAPRDVSASAQWSSRSLACVVAPGGALTARDAGNCVVDVTYNGMAAAVESTVAPAFTVNGTVRDLWEIDEPPIANATITVASGPRAGQTVQSDANGVFRISRLPVGPTTVRVEFAGFESQTAEVTLEQSRVNFALVTPLVTETWERVSPDPPPGILIPSGGTFYVPLEQRHRGPVVMVITSTRPSDFCGTWDNFDAYLNGLIDLSWDREPGYCVSPTRTVRGTLTAGQYTVRVGLYAEFPATRSVRITHPR